jgi:hypothetical protein
LEKKTQVISHIFLLALFLLFVPVFASAASLNFVPSIGQYQTGDDFSVKVNVSSQDQSISAAAGVINFSRDILEVSSLSKSGSVFNLWVQEPSFSNANGTVNFEGVVLDPGFIGNAGKVITINFRVKNTGSALLSFSFGSVLANDGKGTDILQNLGSAQFAVSEKVATAPTVDEVLLSPSVTSPSHPDPEKWYSAKDATFQWEVPNDITQVSSLLDLNPKNETTKLRGLIKEYTYRDLEDGVWYFHIKFKNAYGWGPVTHFPIHIDTVKPEAIVLRFPHGQDSLDNRPVALFNTVDNLSGIDHYEVIVGDKYTYQLLPDDITDSNPYVIPPQEPGKYTLKILAYDKAGNTVEAQGNFEVIALDLPQITNMPDTIYEGDLFRITGKTYPKATVVAILKKNNQEVQEENAFTNELGQFSFTWPTYLKKGQYTLTFFVVNENGAKSLRTPDRNLLVQEKYVVDLGILRLTMPMVVWLNIILFLVINGAIAYAIYHFAKTRIHVDRRFEAMASLLFHNYEHIPAEKRVYYEMIDDIIYRMRLRDGEKIFKTISTIPGLSVNKESGRVEKIKGSPSAIIAKLVKHFQKEHGVNINFSFNHGKPISIIK